MLTALESVDFGAERQNIANLEHDAFVDHCDLVTDLCAARRQGLALITEELELMQAEQMDATDRPRQVIKADSLMIKWSVLLQARNDHIRGIQEADARLQIHVLEIRQRGFQILNPIKDEENKSIRRAATPRMPGSFCLRRHDQE